jgi:hypothetical protein
MCTARTFGRIGGCTRPPPRFYYLYQLDAVEIEALIAQLIPASA